VLHSAPACQGVPHLLRHIHLTELRNSCTSGPQQTLLKGIHLLSAGTKQGCTPGSQPEQKFRSSWALALLGESDMPPANWTRD